MDILVAGAKVASGTSKTTGQPFELKRLHVLTPINPVDSPNFRVNALAGFEQAEIECTTEVINQLKAIPLPCNCRLDTTNELRFGSLQTVVTKVTKLQS